MNIKRSFIALFRAVQQLNEEQPLNEMRDFLADADPYIFKDRRAAVEDIQRQFECSKSILSVKDFTDTDILYEAVYGYLKEFTVFSNRFSDISKDEWKNLCDIIDKECDEEGIVS
ncbi:MAG: hypothetical protein NC120_02110 [Ruminococcus sp.]|nr:hypothetical protein [Ruminococcus sp.]